MMETDPVVISAEIFSFTGIIVSAIIFLRLMFKAHSIGSFRFQLSIFILIWVAAEIPHIFDSLGLIDVTNYLQLGLILHLISMLIFAGFIGLRSLRFLLPHTPSQSSFFSPTPATSTDPLQLPKPPSTRELDQ